jgi:hypothetical protein
VDQDDKNMIMCSDFIRMLHLTFGIVPDEYIFMGQLVAAVFRMEQRLDAKTSLQDKKS